MQLQQTRAEDTLEEHLGFPLFTDGDDKLGWLINMQAVSATAGAAWQACLGPVIVAQCLEARAL